MHFLKTIKDSPRAAGGLAARALKRRDAASARLSTTAGSAKLVIWKADKVAVRRGSVARQRVRESTAAAASSSTATEGVSLEGCASGAIPVHMDGER